MRGNQQAIGDKPHIITNLDLADMHRLLRNVQNQPGHGLQEENNRNERPESATLSRHKQSEHKSHEEDIRDDEPGIVKPTSTKNFGVMSQKRIPANTKTGKA